MIQSGLVAKLKTVTSSVYANAAPPKSSLPAITVDLEGSFRQRHHGANGYQTGLIDTDFELNIWDKTVSGTRTLAEQVISLLENAKGVWPGGDSPQTLYSVADLEITGEFDDYDASTKIYSYTIFITITHTTV